MKPSVHLAFDAIGTSWSIDIFDAINTNSQKKLVERITSRIELFDKTYSRFRSDSLITSLSHRAGKYIFPDDAIELISLYRDLYQITDGVFTPLIGNVLSDAGYDASYSLHERALTHPEKWDEVLSYHHPELTIKKPLILDFGAAGKGYLVDIVSNILKKDHIHNFCVDAGGDMYYSSTVTSPLRVGLENPENTQQVIGVATILNQSICGSSGNRRRWRNYHHIIDPKTLSSPKEISATWVIAETTMLADALATCLYLVAPDVLQEHYRFEYVVVDSAFGIEKSPQFPGEFFYKNSDTIKQ